MPLNQLAISLILSVALFMSSYGSVTAMANDSFVVVQKRLYRHLMEDYEKVVRPVLNDTDPVRVDFGLALITIADLNEQDEVLEMTVWKRMQWADPSLVWDPQDYGGMTMIHIPASEIWTPDIVPYNAAQPKYEEMFEANVIAYNVGIVMCIPTIRLSTICPLDLTYFPHDTQECRVVFGSWTHSGFKMNLSHYESYEAMDLSDYNHHSEWTLLEAGGRLIVAYYPCCPEPYPSITYTLRLRRQSAYLNGVFLAPAVMLALLVPVMFLVPSESGEKITLGTGLLLAMMLLFMMLVNYLPSAHLSMPLLGYYYIVCMVTTSISLGASAVIVSVWYRSLTKRPLPGIVRTVVLGLLGRVLFVTQDDVTADNPSLRFRRFESTASVEGPEEGDKDRIIRHDSSHANVSEWRQLAIILDRLCFLVFFLSVIIISAKMASGT